MLDFLVHNIFVEFGGFIFQQTVGIPMGTNCAPLLADLFFHSYEAEFIHNLLKDKKKKHLEKFFNFTFRYIDDVLSLNNPYFSQYLHLIYPSELEIKDTTDIRRTASYLDLFLNIDTDGRLHMKIYDKRDDFNFPIINFPFLSSNIPYAPSFGVYISQLIRYSRACSHSTDFICVLLTQKLIQQSYEEDRLKLTLRKFYGHRHQLVDPYDVSLTKLAKDIFTTW